MPPPHQTQSGGEDFAAYRKLIVDSLERLTEEIRDLRIVQNNHRDEQHAQSNRLREETSGALGRMSERLATLEVKSGVWGAAAGGLAALLAIALAFAGKLLGGG